MAAFGGYVEVIQKLWDFAKNLQLTPEELRIEVFLPKTTSIKLPGLRQQIYVMLK
jgi:ABC-type arginine transport system permease subunit